MKKLLIAALMAVSATCQQPEAVKAEFPIQEINARVFGDLLPVDGCNAHIVLDLPSTSSPSNANMRLPTEATRPLMDKIIKAEIAKQPANTLWMGEKNVTIRYRETEQTAKLLCGWNANQDVRVIELLEIRER